MPSDFLKLVKLSRLFDSAFPLVSLFLGTAVAGQLNSPSLFLLIPVIVILNSVAMIWNDIEDRQVDADNGRPELKKPTVALLQRLKMYVVVLVSIGLILAGLVNLIAFTLAIATLCIIWIYNSKPIQASRRPIMSIVILSGAGAFLPYLFGLSLGNIEVYTLAAGVFWWLGRVSLSVLKDYKDARGDALHHKKTFLLRYGSHRVALTSVISLCVGYAGFIAFMYLLSSAQWAMPILIAAIVTFVYLRRALFDSKATYGKLDNTFRKVAQYQLLLDVGVVLWLM